MNQYQCDVTRLTNCDSGPRDPSKCQIAAVHTYECPRGDDVEARADWQQESQTGSYNVLVGTRRTLRANDDNYIPWAAMPIGNQRGLHLSFLAYAASSRAEWLSYDAQLEKGAAVVADWCKRYGIPPVKISAADVRAGRRGVCGHGEISGAWHESDHSDPGANFPWDVFIDKVKRHMNPTPSPKPPKESDDMTPEQDRILRENNTILKEIRFQLTGSTEIGKFPGLPQSGGRSLYDLTSAIGEIEGVTGTKDIKER